MASRAIAYRSIATVLAERRAEPRSRVVVTRARLSRSRNAGQVDATLTDISRYGCRIESDVRFAPDEPVLIAMSHGEPVAARVMWSDDRLLGCRFDAPIARAVVRSLTLSAI